VACLHHFDGEKSAVISPRLQSYDETVREGHTQYGFPVVGLILKNTRGKTMKKVLFASTALVAFAGAAAADVAVSGSAEIGLINADSVDANGVVTATNTGTTQFHQDLDVKFSMSGETDGGLAFGASVDLDEGAGLTNTGNNGATVFISGAFGTVTVGNTDGAMDFALTEIVGPGSITDSETSHEGFKGSYLDGSYDGQIVRYDYTAGDLSVAISAEALDADTANRSNGYALGAKYAFGDITVGAGYQKADSTSGQFGASAAVTAVAAVNGLDSAGAVTTTAAATNIVQPIAAVTAADAVIADVTATGLSVSGTFGAVTAGLVYTMYDSSVANFDAKHTHIGVSYTQGALTIGGNIGNFDSDTNAQDRDGYGITANYSLGGGATIQAGYESSERNNVDNGGSWSLGLAMSF
jgi:outer membrane protein OmpU